MSATTLVGPEAEERRNDSEHPFFQNGNGISHSAPPVSCDSELRKLDQAELKAAIQSAWKKLERIGKREMGPLLYWLRERLRAQGSRNDLRDQDKGFGAWVEETIQISRRTADRWADEYGLANGLMKRRPTSRQDDQKSFVHEDDDFYNQELGKQGKLIQINYWVNQKLHKQYEQALTVLKKHFKTSSDKEAVLKGVLHAAGQIRSPKKAPHIPVRAASQLAQGTRRNAKVASGRGSATSSARANRSGT
jgi:hypothetical protein